MHFSRANQAELLEAAKTLTASTGWRRDAMAWGIYDADELRGVAVFQAFTGTGAEFHFGMMPGRRVGKEVMQGIIAMAMHPRGMNLTHLIAPIAVDNVGAQVAALKCGAQIEARVRGSLWGGGDAILFSLARGDAGQQQSAMTVTANDALSGA